MGTVEHDILQKLENVSLCGFKWLMDLANKQFFCYGSTTMPRRTRVKICGITRQEDAQAAQALGVDALGFVFVPQSSRFLEPRSAEAIIAGLSSFVTPVGLFLNESADRVAEVLELIPTLLPQFHGQESAQYCEQFNRPYLKAIGVGAGMPDREHLLAYESSSGFLFDSNEPGQLGGTGHTFDWHTLDDKLAIPLILAGGLNVQNVKQAIQTVKPYAVDVSSGVEIAKGIKSVDMIAAFMAQIDIADRLQVEPTRS